MGTYLAGSFGDAAWGEFRRRLWYKSFRSRGHLAAIDSFFPSSELCATCGRVNDG